MRMIKRAATAAALVFLGAGVATVTAQSSNSSDTYRQLNLFGDVFCDAGVHARSAVGVPVLPLDAPVEVEVIAEVLSEGVA